jgi:hypothetical protein
MPSEKRRKFRAASPGTISVAYTDSFWVLRRLRAEMLDISTDGCKVLIPHRLTLREFVKIEEKAPLVGMASIRFQKQTARGFLTGLEFVGGCRGPELSHPAV